MIHTRRHGFTLIEVLLVAIVLAIIGAMIVPRLAGRSAVTVQLAAERVASMLSTYALRSSLAGQPVSLLRDGDTGLIEVWVLDIDPERPDLPPDWRLDRFSKPMLVPEGVTLTEFRANGERLMPDAWRVVSTPGLPRPRIEMLLTSDEDGSEVTVVLEPRGSAPYLIIAGKTDAIDRVPVDLDREGREKEIW